MGEHISAINLMIEKGGIIWLHYMQGLAINSLLYIMLFSTGVQSWPGIITINKAMARLLEMQPNEEIKELWADYKKGQLWKPHLERHSLFPDKIKNRIYYFLLSAKAMNGQLKLPKPLQWIIINLFIKN
jgi:hypothetical protein